jgi:putative tryptophan/tyrosine transport system substrate-binding protein
MKTLRWYLIGICILLVAVSGCGEKKPKVYRIGILSGAEPFVDIANGFKTKMAQLGFAEGTNIVYDLQKSNFDPAAEKSILKKFISDKVDLIFAFPTEQAVAAKEAALKTNIPVIFAMAGIEGNTLIKSVREPGGNITGVRFPGAELTVKRFEFLRELAPHATRILLAYDRHYPTAPSSLEGLRAAAHAAAITLVEDPVDNVQQLRTALQARSTMADSGVDAILIMPDILNNSPQGFGTIINFADAHTMPVGGGMNFTADLGALFSFVPDNFEMGKLAAILAEKIFNGIPAGKIPVVTPEARLRLNYKKIQALGLTPPAGLLNRADKIIR